MSPWWTLLAMGFVTFGVRVLPLLAVERVTIPARVHEALGFVPIAVLSAIVAQEVLAPGDSFDISAGNPRLIAAVVAGVLAWRTRNVLVTVAGGMGVLWLVEWLA